MNNFLLSFSTIFLTINSKIWMKQAIKYGHMEKQETEMTWKLEMETGNGNWKQKLDQKLHQSLV